jgi:hypothetical protein
VHAEIRVIIWHHLLLRDATISPGWVRYIYWTEYKIGSTYWPSESARRFYRYQWGERPQKYGDQGFEPAYCGRAELVDLTIMVTTVPTLDQANRIARGDMSLSFTYHKENCTQTRCDGVLRGQPGHQFPEVINLMDLTVEPLHVGMLRVSKLAHAECSAILYGENTFNFEISTDPQSGVLHTNEELEHYRNRIPGITTRGGLPQPQSKFRQNIIDMFVPGGFRPNFVARNPILSWFKIISPTNTALLTKVKIQGRLTPESDGVGFGPTLQILTNILKATCPNLKELALFTEDKKYFCPINSEHVKRADELVGNVVNTLTSSKILRLDVYHPARVPDDMEDRPFVDEWDKAVRWVKEVQDREPQEMATTTDLEQFDVAEAISGLRVVDEQLYQRGGRQGQHGSGRGRGGFRGQREGRGRRGRGH